MMERRLYERYTLPMPVMVNYTVAGKRRSERTMLRDIAIGGANFPLVQAPEVGSELNINLTDSNFHLAQALGLQTPDDSPLNFQVNGRVVRRERSDNGSAAFFAVEFLSPLRISAVPLQ